MIERSKLKNRSKLVMSKNYWNMFFTCNVVLMSIGLVTYLETREFKYVGYTVLIQLILQIFDIFVINPLKCAQARFMLHNRDFDKNIYDFFSYFKHDYIHVVAVMVIKKIKIFLWSLLFVVPGIIKSYEYSMIPYILSEDYSLSLDEVFEYSKRLTNGNKFNIFLLDLSFIGWFLLGSLLIIGIFFINPYYQCTYAELYVELKCLHVQ